FVESLALIFGDLSPSSASAHMNYLITLLKSYQMTKRFALSMGAYHTSFSNQVKACQQLFTPKRTIDDALSHQPLENSEAQGILRRRPWEESSRRA
ncbi:MAG: hypothetical protein ACQEQ6_03660, partial [Pseudomonadota bacterium]